MWANYYTFPSPMQSSEGLLTRALPKPGKPAKCNTYDDLINPEVKKMHDQLMSAAKREIHIPGSRTVIGIVSDEKFAADLTKSLNQRPSGTPKLQVLRNMFRCKHKKSLRDVYHSTILITTATNFEAAIKDFDARSRHSELVLVVHDSVGKITFSFCTGQKTVHLD